MDTHPTKQVFRMICRCPFCWRGEGDVRVDLDAWRTWTPPLAEQGDDRVDLERRGE